MHKIRILSFTFLLSALNIIALAQQFSTINGKVTTSDGKPAAFISVGLKGKGMGSITDETGAFSITRVRPGTYTIRASAIGINSSEKIITIASAEIITVDFMLVENDQLLKEVTINGNRTNKYATKKSDYVSKMPLNNLENPQVYTTISKAVLADQLVFSVDDATRNVPGLQKMWEATSRGGDGGAYYSSRGFILQSQLRNGVAGNVSSRIDAANLESVEVIKGPSATLFGSTLTSYGGLINRVTKKPYETFGGELEYATGSFGFNRLSADLNAPLDSAKKALLRINTAYNYEGTFQDNGFDKGVIFAPSFSYQVNDRLNFQLDAELSSGTNIAKPAFFFYFPIAQLGFDRADEAGIDYSRSFQSNDLTQKYRSTNFFAQANYKMSGKWTSQTNFTSTYSFSNGRNPYFFLVPNAVATGDPSAVGADYISRGDQSTANSQINVLEFQQNFNGEFNLGRVKNRMVLGLDFLHQNSNQLFYSVDTYDMVRKNGTVPNYADFNEANLAKFYADKNPDDVFKYPIRYLTNTYSAYASDVINVTDNLIALAALRVDRFDNKGDYDETTGTRTGAYGQTAFSPKFGLVFQPLKDKISIFANYQNGFTNVTGTDYQGNTFKPEHANQIEGGIKLNAFAGKLSGTLSYYNIKVKDIVRGYNGDPLNPNASIQDGNKISKGFEAELIANPFLGLDILAGFSYNDNKLQNASPDVEGRRDSYSMSPYAANLWISYKISTGSIKGLGIGFGGNYASDNKIINSVSMGEFILPAYTILNGSLFYDQSKYRIGAKVDNLTNEKYWIGYGTMNPQKLRNFTASVAYKF